MWEISLIYFTFSTQVFTKSVNVLGMLNLPGKNDFIYRRQIFYSRRLEPKKRKKKRKEKKKKKTTAIKNVLRLFAVIAKVE